MPKLYKHDFDFTVQAILSMIKDKGTYMYTHFFGFVMHYKVYMHLRAVKFTWDMVPQNCSSWYSRDFVD